MSFSALATHAMDPVETELLAIAREHTKTEGRDWTFQTTLAEANIDSFDLVELIFAIEDRFGIEVDFNANAEAGGAMTFGDIAALIRTGLAAKARGA